MLKLNFQSNCSKYQFQVFFKLRKKKNICIIFTYRKYFNDISEKFCIFYSFWKIRDLYGKFELVELKEGCKQTGFYLLFLNIVSDLSSVKKYCMFILLKVGKK